LALATGVVRSARVAVVARALVLGVYAFLFEVVAHVVGARVAVVTVGLVGSGHANSVVAVVTAGAREDNVAVGGRGWSPYTICYSGIVVGPIVFAAWIPVVAAVLGAALDALVVLGAVAAVAVAAKPAVDGARGERLVAVALAVAAAGSAIFGARIDILAHFTYVVAARLVEAVLDADHRVFARFAHLVATGKRAAIFGAHLGVLRVRAFAPLAQSVPARAATVQGA